MPNLVFVSTSISIIEDLAEYFLDKRLDPTTTFFVIEFFEQEIPKDLPANCFATKDLLDLREIDRISQELRRIGEFSGVISMGELSIYPAADFRRYLGVPGPEKSKLERFRDKQAMKLALLDSGLRAPKIYSKQELRNNEFSFPLVVKPKAFCGPIGVRILRDNEELEPLLLREPSPIPNHYDKQYPELRRDDFQCEEFIAGDIFEINCLVAHGAVVFSLVFRQINTSLDFMNGAPLGTISISDPAENAEWNDFAAAVLSAMKAPNGAVVMQAIQTTSGDRIFLGATTLPPSPTTSRLIREATGLDLRWAHIQSLSGQDVYRVPINTLRCVIGGLIFPMKYIEEGQESSSFVETFIPIPEGDLPTLIRAHYPAIGSPAENDFSYSHNLGRFLFNGDDRFEVEQDIRRAMEIYKVRITHANSAS